MSNAPWLRRINSVSKLASLIRPLNHKIGDWDSPKRMPKMASFAGSQSRLPAKSITSLDRKIRPFFTADCLNSRDWSACRSCQRIALDGIYRAALRSAARYIPYGNHDRNAFKVAAITLYEAPAPNDRETPAGKGERFSIQYGRVSL